MEPNIRIKRYAKSSKRFSKPRRRRGAAGTVFLILLILVVATLAVSIAFSPKSYEKPARRVRASVEPTGTRASPGGGLEESRAPAAEETAPASRAALGSLTVDPALITPSSIPNPTGDEGIAPSLGVTLSMRRTAPVTVTVVDEERVTVARLFSGTLFAGSHTFEWKGAYRNGDAAASGAYYVRVTQADGDILQRSFHAVSFLTRGSRSHKRIALTIEDGSDPDIRIVSYLRKNKVPATAFLTGRVAAERPRFVRQLMAARMEIANRTYDREALEEGTVTRANMLKAQRALTKVSGYNHGWLRLPQATLSSRVLRIARANGFRVVQWSVDSGDMEDGTTEERVSRTLESAGNGSIIRTHFDGQDTYDYIEQIVPALRKRGYRFVTMSQLAAGMRLDQNDVPLLNPLTRSLRLPKAGPLGELY